MYRRVSAFPPMNGIAAMRLDFGGIFLDLDSVPGCSLRRNAHLRIDGPQGMQSPPALVDGSQDAAVVRRRGGGLAFGVTGCRWGRLQLRVRSGVAPRSETTSGKECGCSRPCVSRGVGWGWSPVSSQPGLSAEITIFSVLSRWQVSASRILGTHFNRTRRVSIASIAAHFFLLDSKGNRHAFLATVSIASIAAHFFLPHEFDSDQARVGNVSIASIAAHFFLRLVSLRTCGIFLPSQSPRLRRTSSYLSSRFVMDKSAPVSIASIAAHFFLLGSLFFVNLACEFVSIASIAAHFFLLGGDDKLQQPKVLCVSIASIVAHFFRRYTGKQLHNASYVSIASIAAHFFLWKISITRNRKQVKSHRREIGALLPTALLTKKR